MKLSRGGELVGPEAGRLAEAGAEDQDVAGPGRGQGLADAGVATDAGDAEVERMVLGEDPLGARRAHHASAEALDQGADRRRGVAGAEAEPHHRRLGREPRGVGGDRGRCTARRQAFADGRRCEARTRRTLDIDRQAQVGHEAAGPGQADRELAHHLRYLPRVLDRDREVTATRTGQEPVERRDGLLGRDPAAVDRRGRGRHQDDVGAFPARGEEAGHGVGQAGAGGGEDQDRSPAGERRLDRREGRAALVAQMQRGHRAVRDGVEERRDRAAHDAEGVGDAEANEGLDQRGRDGERRGRDRRGFERDGVEHTTSEDKSR
jgi:hypothetical protein